MFVASRRLGGYDDVVPFGPSMQAMTHSTSGMTWRHDDGRYKSETCEKEREHSSFVISLCPHFKSQIHPENQPWQTLNVFLVFTHDDTWFDGLSTIHLPYFARQMVLPSSPWSFPIASPAAIHHCQWPSPSRHRHYHYNNDTMYK